MKSQLLGPEGYDSLGSEARDAFAFFMGEETSRQKTTPMSLSLAPLDPGDEESPAEGDSGTNMNRMTRRSGKMPLLAPDSEPVP